MSLSPNTRCTGPWNNLQGMGRCHLANSTRGITRVSMVWRRAAVIEVRPAGQQAAPLQDDLPGRRAAGARAAFMHKHRRADNLQGLRFAGRFARRQGDCVDYLPGQRISATEPVRPAVPGLPQ